MRHRSRPLQVSTFPFLAVLLCTMGSLILLLLVIDRRAKAIARAKAIQAAEQAGVDDARAVAAARAEFERRRAALHESLFRQEQEVASAINKTKAEEIAKNKELQSQEALRRESEARLEAELLQLRQEQLELEKHKADVTREEQNTQPFSKELTELTRELLILEQTLASLKQARQHDQQHYSVVPYRGRFGESRKPLYLECRATSLVFHQRGPVLEGATLTQAGIRSEAKRYLESGGADPPTQSALYLLLLIRPDGIGTYYRTLAALEGMPIEYGYELVDTNWVLDFPDNGNVASQPSLAADVIDHNNSGNRADGVLKTPAFGQPQAGSPDRPAEGVGEPRGLASSVPSGNGRSIGGSRDGFAGTGSPKATLARNTGSPSQLFAVGQQGVPGVSPVGTSGGRSESVTQDQPSLPHGISAGDPGPAERSLTPPDNFDRGSGSGVSGQAIDARSNGLNGLDPAGLRSGLQTPLGSVSEGTLSGGAASAPPFATPVARDTKALGLGATGSGLPEPVLAPGQPDTGSEYRTHGTPRPGYDPALVGNGTSPLSAPTGYTQGAGGTGSLSASDLGERGGTATGSLAAPVGNGMSTTNSPTGYAGGTGPGFTSEAGRPGQASSPPLTTPGGNRTSPLSSISSYSQTSESIRSPSAEGGPALLAGALPAERTPGAQSGNGGSPTAAPGEANNIPGNPPALGQGAPPDGATDSRPFQDHALPPIPDAEGRATRNQLPPRQTIRRYGHLDWVISVECTADSLLLSPAGMRIPTAALRTAAGAENLLAGAMRELIGRRQASVPAGEPAYRPRIRFLVRPDGLRSYYEACTALEPLQLPMTRENVRREKKTEALER
jgi:hypothetical protein